MLRDADHLVSGAQGGARKAKPSSAGRRCDKVEISWNMRNTTKCRFGDRCKFSHDARHIKEAVDAEEEPENEGGGPKLADKRSQILCKF